MKYKTTQRELRERACNLRTAGYCDLQYLLYYKNANAYTSGTYGWNFDVYEVYNLTICTGYRGMLGERLQGIREYNQKAEDIILSSSIPYDERQEQVELLLKEFCKLNGGF